MQIKILPFGPYAQDVDDGIGFLIALARLVPLWDPLTTIVVSTRIVVMITSRGFYSKLFVLPYPRPVGAIFSDFLYKFEMTVSCHSEE